MSFLRKMNIPYHNFQYVHDECREYLSEEFARLLTLRSPEDIDRYVHAFEEEFADYFGAKYAVGVGSGTAALFFSLKALGIGNGDRIITVANTYVGTIRAIQESGAACIFVDVDRATGMMDVQQVKDRMDRSVKAIIPVHMYGNMVAMKELATMADECGVPVIEDACQAIGSKQSGRYAGAWSVAGCFSFHINKIVGTFGDGGMVITNDKKTVQTIVELRTPGWNGWSVAAERTPSRLDALHIPFLRIKLKNLSRYIRQRKEIATVYRSILGNCGKLRILTISDDTASSYRNFIVMTAERDRLKTHLLCHGIGSSILYPQSADFTSQLIKHGAVLNNTLEIARENLSLPIGHIDVKQAAYIAQTILDFFKTP